MRLKIGVIFSIILVVIIFTLFLYPKKIETKNKKESYFIKDSPIKLALVLRSVSNPLFIEIEKTALSVGGKLGIKIIIKKVTQEIIVQEQIDILRKLKKENISALIIDPVDSMALLPVIREYQFIGVPVVSIDCEFDKASIIQFDMKEPIHFGNNNEEAGYNAAQYLSEKIKKKTNIILIEGNYSSLLSDQRKKGAIKAFSKNPNIMLIIPSLGYWDKDQAYEVTKKLFRKYKNIGCIFCIDDIMACGAAQYLSDTHKKNVLLSGFGDLKASEKYIKNKKMILTVAGNVKKQTFLAVRAAYDLLHRKKVAEKTIVEYSLIDINMLK